MQTPVDTPAAPSIEDVDLETWLDERGFEYLVDSRAKTLTELRALISRVRLEEREAAVKILTTRAAGYGTRSTVVYNGAMVEDELLRDADAIRSRTADKIDGG